MPGPVKAVPDGYHSVTPYLIVDGAARAIEFYRAVFAASEIMRMEFGEKVGHAELQIGDSRIMLADEHPEAGAKGPESFGGSPVMLHVYLTEVDAVVERAVAAGATLVRPVQEHFYGDRSGMIRDPFGHTWAISTHVEDVPPEELKRRQAAMEKGCPDGEPGNP